jgi:hypothetical protein
VPMAAVARHLPPRPNPAPNAPGMFGFCNPDPGSGCFAAAGWAPPEFSKLDPELDIAAGFGPEAAIEQTIRIGAVNSWLRNQPAGIVSAAIDSLREAFAPYVAGQNVRLPGAVWLIRSAPA